ncbi:tRNA threonylcarbamoyladenosine biosynthesis protein TsaB, partial [Campylobacter upsaliensis]
MLGIYDDDRLIREYQSELKASEFIPEILQNLLKEFEFKRL